MNEHFQIDNGVFAARREDASVGNRRFGFSHYMVGNIEIAMLTGVNERFSEQAYEVAKHTDVQSDACYMEFYSSMFMVSAIIVLSSRYKDSSVHPSIKVRTGLTMHIEDFKFHGDYNSAKAYFTFAKLTK